MGRWDKEDQPAVKGDWSDVGAALAGPFDRFLPPPDPYAQMRRAPVDDRRDEEWPTARLPGENKWLEQSATPMHNLEKVEDILNAHGIKDIAPATRLGIDAGIHDMGRLSDQEVLKFLFTNEATGPNPPPKSTGYPNGMTLEEYEKSIRDFNAPQVPLPRPRPKGR